MHLSYGGAIRRNVVNKHRQTYEKMENMSMCNFLKYLNMFLICSLDGIGLAKETRNRDLPKKTR